MDFDDYDDSTDDTGDDDTDDTTDDTTNDTTDDAPDDTTGDDLADAVDGDLDTQDGFASWSDVMHDMAPELSDETLTALWEDPDNRDYEETELVDTALHPDYEAQRSILTDKETGQAVRDAENNFVDCPRNTKGAQRPDGMKVDDTGVHLREAKNYSNLSNLKQNIKHQTEDRRTAFGDDVDLTYVVAPNFTVEEAEKLQDYVENKLGVKLEWQLR